MSLPYGTSQPGERLVLITEDLFMSLVEQTAEAQGAEFDVEWGGKTTATITYFTPVIYEVTAEADADPLTLAATGD